MVFGCTRGDDWQKAPPFRIASSTTAWQNSKLLLFLLLLEARPVVVLALLLARLVPKSEPSSATAMVFNVALSLSIHGVLFSSGLARSIAEARVFIALNP